MAITGWSGPPCHKQCLWPPTEFIQWSIYRKFFFPTVGGGYIIHRSMCSMPNFKVWSQLGFPMLNDAFLTWLRGFLRSAAASEGLRTMAPCKRCHFNMAKSNWPHSLNSGIVYMNLWIIQQWHTVKKKFFPLVDHYMTSTCYQFAEISAKILASRPMRSNCNSKIHYDGWRMTALI